ncbi:MAG: DUF928 domain-containing protein [Potamolinea sp.]
MWQIKLGCSQFSWARSLKLALITGLFAFVQVPQVILAEGIPQRWEATEYQPQSGIGKPRRIIGAGTRNTETSPRNGARRGSSCQFTEQPPLTALVPENGLGVTVSAQPTFYVYVPARSPQATPLQIEFHLKDKNDIDIYQTSFQTIGKPGIVAITLPTQAGLLPLEIGQDYKWTFSVGCSVNDRSTDITVGGVVRRVELNDTLNNQLKQASRQKQVELYAEAGIWQDALTTLIQLKRENPTDPEVISAWTKLLSSVDLKDLTQELFVQIPTTSESQLTSTQKFYQTP